MAAYKLGFVDHYEEAVTKTRSSPKVIIVSEKQTYISESTTIIDKKQIDFTGRAMSMQKLHKAFPVTGGLCTATASRLKGTVVSECSIPTSRSKEIVIGHPTGSMGFVIDIEDNGENVEFNKIAVYRTARRLMEGYVYVPKHLYWGDASEPELLYANQYHS